MADDPYGFLSSVSAHRNRPGDTSNLNPAFATPMANAIRQARAEGLNIGLESGFRAPSTLVGQGRTGSAASYDAGGNSSHSYGLAGDVSGLDGPNGNITNRWAQIAEANGLHNPYGIGDVAEFNHWQLPEQPLEQNPKLLASLKEASATGNLNNVWSAYNSGGGPTRVGTATPGQPAPFTVPTNAPMGMRNNNPLNIKWYKAAPYEGLVGPSANTDQGDPQMVFKTPEAGWAAAYSLLNQKYQGGKTTPNMIIAGQGGWTPGNTQAAANVAKAAGIGPDDDIGFSDPGKAQKFMRALVQQEQGGASSAYPDAMIKSAVYGTTLNSTPSGASTVAASAPPAAAGAGAPPAAAGAGAPGGTLPGFQPGSPAAKSMAAGLKTLGGGGQTDEPPPMQLQQAQPAQAMGGPMMMRPGGQNIEGRMQAAQALAQQGAQQGFMTQPTLAAFGAAPTRSPVPAAPIGLATGMPGLPGTTLNSPSQLQMALMTGAMSPYDLYAANAGTSGGGFGSM